MIVGNVTPSGKLMDTSSGSNGQVIEKAKVVRLTAGEKCLTVKYPREVLSVDSICIYAEKE